MGVVRTFSAAGLVLPSHDFLPLHPASHATTNYLGCPQVLNVLRTSHGTCLRAKHLFHQRKKPYYVFIRCTCSFSNSLHRKRAGALALAVFALFQYKLVLKRLKLHFLLHRYKRSYVHFLLVSVCQKHITISLRFLIT